MAKFEDPLQENLDFTPDEVGEESKEEQVEAQAPEEQVEAVQEQPELPDKYRGKSFEDVVKELGKTIKDIDLGVVTNGELPDTKVSEAAFNAELNKPTDIIDGVFGPVIVRVSEINAETTTAYNDVKDQLRNELALQRAGDEVFNTFDAVEDERAAGSNLTDTAKALNLKTRTVTKIDAQGRDENGNAITDIPVLQQLLRVAFETQPGDDTRELPVGDDGFLWYEVEEITPTRQKELSEVESDVRDAWVTQETKAKVLEIANGVAERIRKGDDMNVVLAETLPVDSIDSAVKYETSIPLTRNAQEAKIGNAAISEGFDAKNGDIKVAETTGGDVIVLRVAEVQEPDDKTIPADAIEQLNTAAADDVLNQVIQDMQSRLDVTISPDGIEAAFNTYGGGHGM